MGGTQLVTNLVYPGPNRLDTARSHKLDGSVPSRHFINERQVALSVRAEFFGPPKLYLKADIPVTEAPV